MCACLQRILHGSGYMLPILMHDCFRAMNRMRMKTENCIPNKRFLQVIIRACMHVWNRYSSLACMYTCILSHLYHCRHATMVLSPSLQQACFMNLSQNWRQYKVNSSLAFISLCLCGMHCIMCSPIAPTLRSCILAKYAFLLFCRMHIHIEAIMDCP